MEIDYETEVMRLARTGRPRLENPRSEGVFYATDEGGACRDSRVCEET